jgi:hypothetical protein
MFRELIHKFQHLRGTNTGKIASWMDDENNIYLGFECEFCKQIDRKTVTKIESEYIHGRNSDDDFDVG